MKVQWFETAEESWAAELLTSGPNKYRTFPLQVGNSVNLEISSERRCTGFADAPGERTVCPRFVEIESGSQCHRCRNRDIYTGYVEGRGSEAVKGTFDVYMAQCGSDVKVGVTRHGRVMKRWVEQGADYGALLAADIEQDDALSLEAKLSEQGVSERVQKQAKVSTPAKSRIKSVASEHGESVGDIVDVQSKTVYPSFPEHPFSREGRFVGQIAGVKGQLVATQTQCMAMTSGRVVTTPSQRGLDDYT